MNLAILLSMPGFGEWVVIIAVIMILFGGKKIPELMRGLGEGISEFKKAKDGITTPVEKTEKSEKIEETKS